MLLFSPRQPFYIFVLTMQLKRYITHLRFSLFFRWILNSFSLDIHIVTHNPKLIYPQYTKINATRIMLPYIHIWHVSMDYFSLQHTIHYIKPRRIYNPAQFPLRLPPRHISKCCLKNLYKRSFWQCFSYQSFEVLLTLLYYTCHLS